MTFSASTKPSRPALSARSLLERMDLQDTAELVSVMARREALRFLALARSRQSLVLALVFACGLAFLIPLHRTYGGTDGPTRVPYFLFFALSGQLALFLLASRAVWAGMRHDAAAGTVEELLLTGASVSRLLLGKWLGVAAAGGLWTLMLLPVLVLAGAFTGASPLAMAGVAGSWLLTAATGALAGTLLAVSERGSAVTVAPVIGLVQFWFFSRWVLPILGSGLGPWFAEILRWLRLADPLTLVPAAIGLVREPWLLKAAVLLGLFAVAGTWLLLDEGELRLPERKRREENESFFSLRPVRAWMMGPRGDAAPEYTTSVIYPFERVFGWRFRVNTVAWICVLFPLLIPTIPLAVLGPEKHLEAKILLVLEAGIAGAIGALGAAASLAAERELGRWVFLLCSRLTEREVVLAKWRAACVESWPLWALAGVQALAFAASGTLPWRAVLPAALALPVAAAVGAAVSAALCARSPSLTSAQQRAGLWILGPPLVIGALAWLLPQLAGLGYLSLSHLLFSALGYRPGFAAPGAALAAMGLYGVLAAGSLVLAVWQLRRWPPV